MIQILPLALAEGVSRNPLIQFVPLILIFGIFYFFLFAPMRKRQKALEQLIENLKKGDRIVTTGGVHGEIASVKDKVVLVKVADNVKLRISRSAVAGLEGSEADS
ncbi:MAG: preprotein translocase subunit YajC [Acidobacteriota bacterium]|nr:preprotein translocase subunit YajC [Acidobacteriota bacterium]